MLGPKVPGNAQTPVEANGGVVPPQAHPADLLRALVDVINTQDPAQINLFVRQKFAIDKFPADSITSVKVSYEQVSRTLLISADGAVA